MSITSDFDVLLQRIAGNDRRTARRAGQHIDSMSAGLKELRELSEAEKPQAFSPDPIPAGTVDSFMKCSMSELNDLAKRFNLPKRSKVLDSLKGKGRGKEVTQKRRCLMAEFLVTHKVPALTYENLLAFYLQSMDQKALPGKP